MKKKHIDGEIKIHDVPVGAQDASFELVQKASRMQADIGCAMGCLTNTIFIIRYPYLTSTRRFDKMYIYIHKHNIEKLQKQRVSQCPTTMGN